VWGRGDALSVMYGWRGKEPGCTGVRDGTTGGALGVSCGAARGKSFLHSLCSPPGEGLSAFFSLKRMGPSSLFRTYETGTAAFADINRQQRPKGLTDVNGSTDRETISDDPNRMRSYHRR
jgi:hypothetical protein